MVQREEWEQCVDVGNVVKTRDYAQKTCNCDWCYAKCNVIEVCGFNKMWKDLKGINTLFCAYMAHV